MLRIFTFCALFFVCFNSWSADYHRKIRWDEKVQDGASKESVSLSFEGGVVLDQSRLPYWLESFDLDSPASKAVVYDAVYEPVPDSLISLNDSIGSDLKFKSEIGSSGGRSVLRLTIFPFVRKDNRIRKLVEFSVSITENTIQLKSATVGYNWKTKSVFATGNWVKIKTKDKGVYRITYDQLKQWGFSNPDQVAMYGNGGYALPVLNKDIQFDDLSLYPVLKGKDSAGKDCLFFYSTGNVRLSADTKTGILAHKQNCYATETYFYLSDQGNVKTIEKATELSATADRQVGSFTNYAFYEKEDRNLMSSGSRWFGEQFSAGQSQTISLALDNPDLTKPVQFAVSAAARSSSSSFMNVIVNGKSLSDISFPLVYVTDPTAVYASDQVVTFSDLVSSKSLQFKLAYTAYSSSSYAWLDYISVNYQSLLSMSGDVYPFRGKGAEATIAVSEFVLNGASSSTRIIDVTDFNNVSEVPAINSGGQLKFKSNAAETREYVAFNTSGTIPAPELVGTVANQNLHGASIPELIIVSNPALESEANKLADFHRNNDGMSVEVVAPDIIYNEFSGGLPDPSGLRNYFRMCYEMGKQAGTNNLKYILLMGDGSYDNRNILAKNRNLLPTYQSENSLSPTESFVTDDFFVFLDTDEGGAQGIVDLGIGRIPANTLDDAKSVVDKIENYYKATSIGNWRNVVTFIADDGDISTHMSQAESLAELVNNTYPAFFTDKIYLDAYKQVSSSGGEKYPDVNAAITNRVKQGTLVMNYTGHANEKYLADENVLDISTIKSWSNYNKLPVFVTATCEFSRFDADETSAGEEILFNQTGGGVGLFSTTRLVYSGANFRLNEKFFNYIFEKDKQGKNLRLGDIMQKAKAAANTGTNQLNFTLLADPAMQLANPAYQVKTISINGKNVELQTDTIGPLSVVTIKGYVADYNGGKVDSFNGEIIPAVYDKALKVETLGNAGETPMSYSVQNNLIYKGLATVKNGEFEFSFIVPKDVSYKIGKGKILYYAYNELVDAKGYFDGFSIGGGATGAATDSKGPVVELFLNSGSFKDGDQVSASSVLIANISDETGINTSGTGIGHDITAVLDGDYTNIMVLNEYFQADKDDYTSGKIVFPLTDLAEGEHIIKLKVWDVLNNSSEVEIRFVVKDDFRIESAVCYPNPMWEQAYFKFTHNQPDEAFDVTLEVFQGNGSLVDSFQTKVGSLGLESLPFEWVPADRQVKMRAGVYIFRITATSNGKKASGSGRLVFVYR